jgi:hypothetical protein
LRDFTNSSSNSVPQMDCPPVPLPRGSPVCSMKPRQWNRVGLTQLSDFLGEDIQYSNYYSELHC